jgi:hypothetical protein
MAKRKRTNNDLQNTTQKTKDRTTRTPLKTGGELRGSGMVSRLILKYPLPLKSHHGRITSMPVLSRIYYVKNCPCVYCHHIVNYLFYTCNCIFED